MRRPARAGRRARSPRARTLAAAATGFAILGFVVGLTFSIRGGDTIDVAYHAAVLPLLLLTLAALLAPAAVTAAQWAGVSP